MKMKNIETQLSDLDSVNLDTSISDYPVFVVTNRGCTAKIALHGAHLFDWTPEGQAPVIYNSPDAIYKEGKAIRGGVPICWPWFNAHPTDPSLPSHGIARNRFWEFVSAEESLDDTTLTFRLISSDDTKAIWPYDFEVTAQFSLGKKVVVTLKTTNTGQEQIAVGGALHTYLSVGSIHSTSVGGLGGKPYLDTVGDHIERIQNGGITFKGEVDRIYQDTSNTIKVLDENKRRILIIDRTGSNTAVVWNPWTEKAAGLGDLPNEAYQDFVCVEAANALNDVRILAPGAQHSLSTTIQVVSY